MVVLGFHNVLFLLGEGDHFVEREQLSVGFIVEMVDIDFSDA